MYNKSELLILHIILLHITHISYEHRGRAFRGPIQGEQWGLLDIIIRNESGRIRARRSPTKAHLQLYDHVKHLVHCWCIIHCTVLIELHTEKTWFVKIAFPFHSSKAPLISSQRIGCHERSEQNVLYSNQLSIALTSLSFLSWIRTSANKQQTHTCEKTNLQRITDHINSKSIMEP